MLGWHLGDRMIAINYDGALLIGIGRSQFRERLFNIFEICPHNQSLKEVCKTRQIELARWGSFLNSNQGIGPNLTRQVHLQALFWASRSSLKSLVPNFRVAAVQPKCREHCRMHCTLSRLPSGKLSFPVQTLVGPPTSPNQQLLKTIYETIVQLLVTLRWRRPLVETLGLWNESWFHMPRTSEILEIANLVQGLSWNLHRILSCNRSPTLSSPFFEPFEVFYWSNRSYCSSVQNKRANLRLRVRLCVITRHRKLSWPSPCWQQLHCSPLHCIVLNAFKRLSLSLRCLRAPKSSTKCQLVNVQQWLFERQICQLHPPNILLYDKKHSIQSHRRNFHEITTTSTDTSIISEICLMWADGLFRAPIRSCLTAHEIIQLFRLSATSK